jgi:peptide deformylase
MAKRSIVTLPDPRLRLVSEPVTASADLRALAQDMLDSMYAARGIGLAAIQIGVPKRVVVVDLGKEPERAPVEGEEETEDGRPREPDPQVFLNPEIVWESEERRPYEEGCLSIPDYSEEVERPERVRVRWQNLEGATQEAELSGLMAVCIQHEIDHLNGRLFIDHLSKLKRDRVVKKFIKAARREQDEA